MKFKRWNQNGVTWTCIVGGYCGFVDSWNFTNKGNPYTSEVEMQTKIMPSSKKSFVSVTRAGVSEHFHPGYRDLGP